MAPVTAWTSLPPNEPAIFPTGLSLKSFIMPPMRPRPPRPPAPSAPAPPAKASASRGIRGPCSILDKHHTPRRIRPIAGDYLDGQGPPRSVGKTLGMPTAKQDPAPQEEAAPEAAAPQVQIEVTDPYKQVFSPWELPANTAAAQAIATQVTVDPDAPISDERKAQAEAAIQAHQDDIQGQIAGVSDDPRLSGGTFTVTAAAG